MIEIEMPIADTYEAAPDGGRVWSWGDATGFAFVALHLHSDGERFRVVFGFGIHEDSPLAEMHARMLTAFVDLRALPLIIDAIRLDSCTVCGRPFKALDCDCASCQSETCSPCAAWARQIA